MSERPPVAPVETLAQYHVYLDEIALLAANDPEVTSADGMRLHDLADAVEAFERVAFPDMFP